MHSYVVALSSQMSGFVLTNRSANIFGNIPFLRGQVYNVCVTCEDLDLQTLNLSQYLHAILPLLLNNSCTYKVSQSANLQAEAKSMLRYLEINLAILRPPRGDRKKSRGGKYIWREFQSLNDINCIKPNVCHIRTCDLLMTFSG